MPGNFFGFFLFFIRFSFLGLIMYLVQTRMDFDERPSGILVPHPSTRGSNLMRSSFQVVRAAVQLLQPSVLVQRGNLSTYSLSQRTDMSLSNFFQFEFLAPLWYPDQIENAISFLASQVSKTYYGRGRNSMDHFIPRDRLRRSQPKHSSLVHHNSSGCQACKDGWCTASGYFIWLSMHLCNISFNYPLFNFIFVFGNFDFVMIFLLQEFMK